MNPMMAAIKKKKGMMGDHDMGHDGLHATDDPHMSKPSAAGHGKLHEFVAGLNDNEKGQLKTLLDKSAQGAQEIAKGGPSSHEKQLISQEASAEGETNAMEQSEHDQPGGDSDDIAMSMLDHNSKNVQPGQKPRNLGERMKFDLASKLKTKGKL